MTSKPQNSDAASRTCLILCMKAPARSKRRLAGEIGDSATIVARHLWGCAQEDLQNWRGKTIYAPADEDDAHWLDGQLTDPGRKVVQSGGNLGERIMSVDTTARAQGESHLLFIGTDCPVMDQNYLESAAEQLNCYDVVLGPATDGGVVLMGARQPWPDLSTLPWSTPQLYLELYRCCITKGLSVNNLEPRSDIDSLAALETAGAELASDLRPARRTFYRWLNPSELAQRKKL